MCNKNADGTLPTDKTKIIKKSGTLPTFRMQNYIYFVPSESTIKIFFDFYSQVAGTLPIKIVFLYVI